MTHVDSRIVTSPVDKSPITQNAVLQAISTVFWSIYLTSHHTQKTKQRIQYILYIINQIMTRVSIKRDKEAQVSSQDIWDYYSGKVVPAWKIP